jgi:uncharacterized SAM-dependent methyltransferase
MSALAHLPVLREPSLAAAIREGLLDSPRRLPPACFYDQVGSALFDAITVLPEYGLTRADLRLLRSQAGRIAAALPRPLDVIELGSGGGGKARVLLEALSGANTLRYRPVDVSAAALADCQERLASLRALEVMPLEATYLDGLEEAATGRRSGATVLVLFAGARLYRDSGEVVVFVRAKKIRFSRGARGYNAGDLPSNEFLRKPGILRLLADSHSIAPLNQLCDVPFCGMVGHAAHRH